MPQEKTAAQEMFEDVAAPKEEVLGGEQGEKPNESGATELTETQKLEKEIFDGKTQLGGTTEEASPEVGEPEKAESDEGKTREFYQTSYQQLLKELDAVSPAVKSRVLGNLKAQRKGKTTEESEPTKKTAEVNLGDDDYLDAKTFKQIMAQEREALRQAIREETQASYQETNARAEWSTEAKVAQQQIGEFIKKNKIPQESVNQAWQEVMNTLGLDETSVESYLQQNGAPYTATKMLAKELMLDGMQRHYIDKVTAVGAETAQKVKAAQLVTQPTGSVASKPKPKTKEMEFLEKIENAGGNTSAREELFS